MKAGTWFIGVGATLMLVVGLSLPTSLARAGEVTVTLDAPAEMTAGSGFVARLNISHIEDFDAAVVRVRFDPTVLSLSTEDADGDGIYDSIGDGSIGGTVIPVAATVEKEPGLVGVAANVPGFPGVSGEGYLMEFHFIALAAGRVSIGLEHHSMSSKDAILIAATRVGVGDLAIETEETQPPPASAEVEEIASPEPSPAPPSETPAASAEAKAIGSPTSPSSGSPSSSPGPVNWLLIGGGIAAAVIVGGGILHVYRLRRWGW